MESSFNSDLFIAPTVIFNCYILVLCLKNKAGIKEKFSAIRFIIGTEGNSLQIILGPSSPINPEEVLDHKQLETTEFIEKLQKDGIKTVEITSSGFTYRSRKEFNVLMLLLQLISITQLQFTIEDCEPDFLEELNLLLSAALHSSQDLTRLALNYSYCKFYLEAQKSLKMILQTAFSNAEKLEKFEFKAFDKKVLFSEIIEEILNAGKGLPRSLKELVLECRRFSNKAIIVRIFESLENIEVLKLVANEIDIDNKTVLQLAENSRLTGNLILLHLSLRNSKVGDDSVHKLLKAHFIKLKDLMIDFGGSDVTNEAFKTLINERFGNFKDVEKFPFDLENTFVTKEHADLLRYLYKGKKNGYKVDDESSDKTVVDTLRNKGCM